MTTGQRTTLWTLAGIGAVGAFLRFYALTFQSLWNDELSSWTRSAQSVRDVIRVARIYDVHPPGYYLFLHGVMAVLGDNEWALRFPSAVAGTLAIGAIFLLGRRLWGEREGLLAALFMAVSEGAIWWSRNARPYAIMLLLTCLSVYFFVGISRSISSNKQPDRWELLGWLVTAVVLAWMHYFGLFLVGLEVMAIVPTISRANWRLWWGFAAMVVAVGLCFAPWLPTMLAHTHRSSWMHPPDFRTLLVFYAEIWAVSRWAGVLLAGIVVVFAVVAFRRHPLDGLLRSTTAGVVIWLILPVVVVWAASREWTPVFSNRNLSICWPAAYLLVARAVAALVPPGRPTLAGGTILAGVLLISVVVIDGFYTRPQRGQFREAVTWVIQRSKADDPPVIVGHVFNSAYLNYYFKHLGSTLRVDAPTKKVTTQSQLLRLVKAHHADYVFLIAAHRSLNSKVLAPFGREWKLVGETDLVGAKVREFQRQPPVASTSSQ